MKKILTILLLSIATIANAQVMLLKTYNNQNIDGWVMSEKLDGVRGFWNGKDLISRQGYSFQAPDFFIKNFPSFAIDGEIYNKRENFDEISSIVRGSNKDKWQTLKLYVFDVPNASGDLFARLRKLELYLQKHPNPYITIIKQIPIQDKNHLNQFFNHIKSLKGEGVVVRNPKSPYINGRSSQILKMKVVDDDECTVIAHIEGKGKYSGKLGSVICKNQYGEFRIGSGFSDKERENPPKIGESITYKYRGFTSKGKPKFATFSRVRVNK